MYLDSGDERRASNAPDVSLHHTIRAGSYRDRSPPFPCSRTAPASTARANGRYGAPDPVALGSRGAGGVGVITLPRAPLPFVGGADGSIHVASSGAR